MKPNFEPTPAEFLASHRLALAILNHRRPGRQTSDLAIRALRLEDIDSLTASEVAGRWWSDPDAPAVS